MSDRLRDDLPDDAALCADCHAPFVVVMNGGAVCADCGVAYPRTKPAWPTARPRSTTYTVRAKDKRGHVEETA